MSIIEEIRQQLFELQDTKYREFQAKLIPNIEPEIIIGIRTPLLRSYAGQLVQRDDVQDFLENLPHKYYDENNLHGMIIEKTKDYNKVIEEINKFLPYIDNWATCDLMRPKVLKKHTDELITEIERWISSSETYSIRFGIEMLMCFYLDEHFKKEYLDMISPLRSDEYYVNMMIAWFFATALAKQWDATIPYLENFCLDKWTHNKTIQKAIESYRITPKQKVYLRSLKI